MTISSSSQRSTSRESHKPTEDLQTVSVRFAGDSGDGMQLVGSQFTTSTALAGNQLSTMPDYPAEIRAPACSLSGVSGFQISFSSEELYTPGDVIQALVVMNAAALKVNLPDLEPGGIIIVNTDGFKPEHLKLAGYESDPLKDGSLASYRVHDVPISTLTREAISSEGLGRKEAERCKNFFALGLSYWLYERPVEPTLEWLRGKFADKPTVCKANELALEAGFNYGETSQAFQTHYRVAPAKMSPGTYRNIRGNDAAALGLIAAAHKAGKKLFYVSYPITPASEILHELVKRKTFGVRVFQTEDEIAAMCAVIGAAYGGAMAATGTSGPGMDLKSEALGLAVALELPCVIINVQRGGPSTGLPTKSEQSDLLQAIAGRHGECPMPVLAAQSPSDCFRTAFEAFQIAVRYMTPVIVLSDGYLANSAEPWRVPEVEELPEIGVTHATDPEGFEPYGRNEDLARPWAIPGTPGMAHRVGGLEKEHLTGAVSYDPQNHQRMSEFRAQKVMKVADMIPALKVLGEPEGDLLVVSWGSTYGAARTAVRKAQDKNLSVSHLHLRHLAPLPKDLGEILPRFRKVLVPELNMGQLAFILRAHYLINVQSVTQMLARPFTVAYLLEVIEKTVEKQ